MVALFYWFVPTFGIPLSGIPPSEITPSIIPVSKLHVFVRLYLINNLSNYLYFINNKKFIF